MMYFVGSDVYSDRTTMASPEVSPETQPGPLSPLIPFGG